MWFTLSSGYTGPTPGDDDWYLTCRLSRGSSRSFQIRVPKLYRFLSARSTMFDSAHSSELQKPITRCSPEVKCKQSLSNVSSRLTKAIAMVQSTQFVCRVDVNSHLTTQFSFYNFSKANSYKNQLQKDKRGRHGGPPNHLHTGSTTLNCQPSCTTDCVILCYMSALAGQVDKTFVHEDSWQSFAQADTERMWPAVVWSLSSWVAADGVSSASTQSTFQTQLLAIQMEFLPSAERGIRAVTVVRCQAMPSTSREVMKYSAKVLTRPVVFLPIKTFTIWHVRIAAKWHTIGVVTVCTGNAKSVLVQLHYVAKWNVLSDAQCWTVNSIAKHSQTTSL